MGKVSELSLLVKELNLCSETLIGISQSLSSMFNSSDGPTPTKSETPTPVIVEEDSKERMINNAKDWFDNALGDDFFYLGELKLKAAFIVTLFLQQAQPPPLKV